MASGDLTASTAVICNDMAAVKVAVDALNLAATTDKLFIVPLVYRMETATILYATKFAVFKVERAA
jgi:hypothetical protein